MAANFFLFWNEVIIILVFILLVVIHVLIPSKEKVMQGKAGSKMRAKWVPWLTTSAAAFSVVGLVLWVFLGNAHWLPISNNIILLVASVLILWEYFSTKRLFDSLAPHAMHAQTKVVHAEVMEAHEIPHDHSQESPYVHHAHTAHGPNVEHHHNAPPAKGLTVECPQCRGRIEIKADQHSITCPYCGLTGSL